MTDAERRLKAFQEENDITSKGRLAFAIQFTNNVQGKTFPLNPENFKTPQRGQVAKLGGSKLKKVLESHGIAQKLAKEAGRTSRGTMELMFRYVSFLNAWHAEGTLDLSQVEDFWAEQIREFFRNEPFTLNADASRTVSANLKELFLQAKKRQSENPGTQYLGIMLQHLTAAKLCVIMPDNSFEIHGASVADAPTGREGDFVLNSTIIHCTTMPGTALIEKCNANLCAGHHPVIITIYDRVNTAISLIEDAGLAGRIEVWDIQQFLSANVYEHSLFDETKQNATLNEIVEKYNAIIDETETDPILRIVFKA